MDEPQTITREQLEKELVEHKKAEEKAEGERREEQDRENLRAAWKQETGVEPTKGELEQALREKRHKDVAEAARLNEAVARRQIHQNF